MRVIVRGEQFSESIHNRHVSFPIGDAMQAMLRAMEQGEPIHITVPGSATDPRSRERMPDGVVVHHTPALHPDDVWIVDGIPTTSPSRTLIDLAEMVGPDELLALFQRAREIGLFDLEAVVAARGRVEWRPSLQMFDEVLAEFLA
jgi:hypothetical protein